MIEIPSQELPVSGDPTIDREHRELLNCVSVFDREIASGDGHDGAVRALHFLLHHAITHFKSEEDRMNSLNYPDTPHHRGEHARLLDEVRAMVDQFHQMRVPPHVASRLVNQILGHLSGSDRQFVEWAQSRTVMKKENGKIVL